MPSLNRIGLSGVTGFKLSRSLIIEVSDNRSITVTKDTGIQSFWKKSVVHFFAWRRLAVISGCEKTREDIELRCRICQASCTFVATKLRFVSTKVTCRLLPHRSDFSLFRLAKKVQETNFTKGLLYDDSKDQVH